MKPEKIIVVVLLDDSSDDDDEVEVIEMKKAAQKVGTAKTHAAATAMKRA